MGEYSKIQKRIWNSPTFNRLSEDAKFLWFYLLTCPHGNILGLFVLKPGYACADLGWSEERFRKRLYRYQLDILFINFQLKSYYPAIFLVVIRLYLNFPKGLF